ncbi:methyl-accepting chemotaxis protein [Roseibium hamelinense]|nr:methyl-accepting chemotaxis protein [Roseibium hamelinense]
MFLAGALTMCVGIVAVTSILASRVANEQADTALTTATLGKSKTLGLAIDQVTDSARFFVSLAEAKDSLMKMMVGWKNLKEDQTELLRDIYVTNNPHSAEDRHKLVEPDVQNYYVNNHKVIHVGFQDLVSQGQFSDVALVDPDGNITYSFNKGQEFARPVSDPEIAGNPFQTALAQMIDANANEALEDSRIYTSGFVTREDGRVSLVLAAPVFYLDRFFGGVALAVNMERFAGLINDKAGLGDGEKVFLIDSAGQLISLDPAGMAEQTYDFADVSVGKGQIVIDGQDYRISQADGAVQDKPFGIVEAVPQAELQAAANQIVMGVVVAGVVCLIPIVGLIWWLTVRMFAPLNTLSGAARRIADGDLEVELTATDRSDEIGEMARCIEVFKDNSTERERLASERKVGHIAREKREKLIDSLISSFRAEAQSVLETVEQNISRVEEMSEQLSLRSNSAAERGAQAVADSQNASSNVQAVASATEELNASISEISRQVATTAEIVGQTTTSAQSSNQKIAGLAEAADRIGDVVSLISEIAEQTNLLALNATIEAARAGDAGKGFAVVASEVKSLAGQTAKATEEISAQIAAIQASTTEAVEEIGKVSGSIEEVNSYTTTITDAVQQQGAATGEISRNVAEAADGTRSVSGAVELLNEDVVENSSSVNEMRQATVEMKQQAMQLRESVEKFLSEVAAA